MRLIDPNAIAFRTAKLLTRHLSGWAARSTSLHPKLHPEIRVLVTLSNLTGPGSFTAFPVTKARKAMAQGAQMMAGPPTPVARVRDLSIRGAAGPLPARHYTSVPHARQRPLLLFFHGGGFCLGDLDTHDEPCRRLSAEGGFDVLSVAYRLAPEHKFPAAIEDGIAAFRWARQHAAELGVDPERIGVGGDSAGANLSTVISLAQRDTGGPAPALQLLIYPAVDRRGDYTSQSECAQGLLLTRGDIDEFTRLYVNDPDERLDPRVSPLLADDHSNLPPAVVVTAGCDPLRDEGFAYAEALSEAGVPVKHLNLEGMVHGFLQLAGASPAADRDLRRVARATAHLFAQAARQEAS